eukprot:gene28982-38340_t
MDIEKAISSYKKLKSKKITPRTSTYHQLLSLVAGLGEQGSNTVVIPRENDPPSNLNEAESIFKDMIDNHVTISESCYTAMIRCYSHSNDPFKAFDTYKTMVSNQVVPKLRTYSNMLKALVSLECSNVSINPTIKSICFELFEDVTSKYNIDLTEKEYVYMLILATHTLDNRFYDLLYQFMDNVMIPSRSSWDIIKKWFIDIDEGYLIKESTVNSDGIVECTGTKLLSIDLDPNNRQLLLDQISSFAIENGCRNGKEATNDADLDSSHRVNPVNLDKFYKKREMWISFTEFLALNRDKYSIVIDGANVGYYKQNYEGASLHADIQQIDWMVQEVTKLGYNPLVILHIRHAKSSELKDIDKEIINRWISEGTLYMTRHGWNDDWFWIFSCVYLQCHIVTNDEMRDHHFQMLRPRWFSRWKERHRMTGSSLITALNVPSLSEHYYSLNVPSLSEHYYSLNVPSLSEHSLNVPSLSEHYYSLNVPSLSEHYYSLNVPSL